MLSEHNLESIYWSLGQFQEAEELQLQVLEADKSVLGRKHPDTLSSMHNLAHTLKSQGRYEEALSLMRECIRFRLPSNSPVSDLSKRVGGGKLDFLQDVNEV